MKIVINQCHGGFSLSKEALSYLKFHYGLFIPVEMFEYGCVDNKLFGLDQTQAGKLDKMLYRTDYRLIDVVETLGEKASGDCAKLKIVEHSIPLISDLIDHRDGYEFI